MPYTPIVATLGYVLSADGRSVLMIHRNTRVDDEHYGKYNGLGGKLEPYEDIVSGMRREISEESGIEVIQMTLRGSINWPGFGKYGKDWLGFLFRVDQWQGQPYEQTPEGTLEWIAIDDLLRPDMDIWPGDRYFLPLVFGDDPRQFHGVMPYQDERPSSWHYVWI